MTATPDPQTDLDPERVAYLEALAQQRYFFLHTVEGLTDDQARLTPTASELCLGGLVKHVALTERGWTDFVEHGSMAGGDDADDAAREREFRLLEDETLEEVVALFHEVAAHTDELIRTCDLSGEPRAPARAVVHARRAAQRPAHLRPPALRARAPHRARRHPPRVDRRSEVDGLTPTIGG